jgi:predicted outer membrane protein
MLSSIALVLLFANTPAEQTTLPRHPDPDPVEQHATREGTPTDPLFDRPFIATDDPAFILTAVENSRQGAFDARGSSQVLQKPPLRDAAARISAQNEATARKLETLAKRKGWRLPKSNPARESTLATKATGRANADFILNQISFHETTLAQFRAQIAGPGDPELKRALREALPGYQRNLATLLTLKP